MKKISSGYKSELRKKGNVMESRTVGMRSETSEKKCQFQKNDFF